MAGMLNYCDFVEQQKVASEDGMLRPDVIVKLPAGKTIIIDAKAPVTSYIDAVFARRRKRAQGEAAGVREARTRPRVQARSKGLLGPVRFVSRARGDVPAWRSLLQRSAPTGSIADTSLVSIKVLIATPVNLIGLLRRRLWWRHEQSPKMRRKSANSEASCTSDCRI
jgi:DNA recombination protein RmuC